MNYKKFTGITVAAVVVAGSVVPVFANETYRLVEKDNTQYCYDQFNAPVGGMKEINGKKMFFDPSGKLIFSFDDSKQSPNYDSREGRAIRQIVIHHWGARGQRFNSVVNWLMNPRSEVSASYVAEDGRVANIVREDRGAWHAGNREVNLSSLGIECRPEATDGDYNTVGALVSYIWNRYGKLPLIKHKDVVATACPGVWDLDRIKSIADGYYESCSPLKKNGNKYYYIDAKGVQLKNKWVMYRGKFMYMDGSGFAVTGKTTVNGKSYIFTADGFLGEGQTPPASEVGSYIPQKSGWIQEKAGWKYYKNGKAQTGWQKIDGHWYVMDSAGIMITGWLKDSGHTYYLSSSGVMTTGWVRIGNSYYLFNKDGHMMTGWASDSGKKYYLKEDGVMASGTMTIDGHVYTFASTGELIGNSNNQGSTTKPEPSKPSADNPAPPAEKNGWVSEGGRWYLYSQGKTVKGWVREGSNWYYLNSIGYMETGWIKDGNTWYHANGAGIMETGWIKVDGAWYYMNASGAMATGWYKVNGAWYYSNGSGIMATGWQNIGGAWYYLGSSGAMATGWYKVNGAWYYSNGSGVMATGWQNIGGAWYYLGSSGAMATGWLKLNEGWYYFSGDGVMATGQRTIDGVNYTFSGSGLMM